MSFHHNLVRDIVHRVAPVRFARVSGGLPHPERYDLDNCGYDPANDKGPIVAVSFWSRPLPGLASTPPLHVRIVRDRLDGSTPLFATVEDGGLAALDQDGPFRGPGIGLKDELCVQAAPSLQGRPVSGDDHRIGVTRVLVHHASRTGPVLARLTVLVYEGITIPVQIHRVQMNGRASVRNDASVRETIGVANAILLQAGIHLELRPIRELSIQASQLPHRNWAQEFVQPLSEPPPGIVDDSIYVTGQDRRAPGVQAVLNHPSAALDAMNVYLVHRIGNEQSTTGGQTWDRRLAAPLGLRRGILLADTRYDSEGGDVLAHEICHLHGLAHFGFGTTDDPAGGIDNPSAREDLWAHRNLLYPATSLQADPRRAARRLPDFTTSPTRVQVDFGCYPGGQISAGHLLNIRASRITGIPHSHQIPRLRANAIRGEYRPV